MQDFDHSTRILTENLARAVDRRTFLKRASQTLFGGLLAGQAPAVPPAVDPSRGAQASLIMTRGRRSGHHSPHPADSIRPGPAAPTYRRLSLCQS